MFKCFICVLYLSNWINANPLQFPDYKNHTCKRECISGITKTCQYELTLEYMFSMEPSCKDCLKGNNSDCYNPGCIVANGKNRLMMVYNRMFPGPQIEVCKGDILEVKVNNQLWEASTSIHWHGQENKGTNYMDGVPFITQCPINSGTSFQYRFRATESGTHWAHSHSGFQRFSGAAFPLIIRQSDRENPHRNKYDFDLSEHVATVSDWSSELPEMTEIWNNRMRHFDFFITDLLINGQGSSDNSVPTTNFTISKGFKYRFRFIASGGTICPIQFKIDNHQMLIISTDGKDVSPVMVDKVNINPGERVDFVIDANKFPKIYTMHFKGLLNCNASATALLIYKNATKLKKLTISNNNNLTLNCINPAANSTNCLTYSNMSSLEVDYNFLSEPHQKYYIAINAFRHALPVYRGVGDSSVRVGVINDISFKFPSTPLIQSDTNMTCNAERRSECSTNDSVCSCTHVLQLNQHEIIEFVIVDLGYAVVSHPMHMHGHTFKIIGEDFLKNNVTLDEVKKLDEAGLLKRKLAYKAIAKDTIAAPSGGYVIIRFKTKNPGYWFFHCHVEHHAKKGMEMVIRVGDQPIEVPQNFPKCGNF